MIIRGRVQNGVVVIDGGSSLPEGAVVTVSYQDTPPPESPENRQRVRFPLVRSERPGSIHLTAERLARILGDEDAPA